MSRHHGRDRTSRGCRLAVLCASMLLLHLASSASSIGFAAPVTREAGQRQMTTRSRFGASRLSHGLRDGKVAAASSAGGTAMSPQQTYMVGIAWYLAHFFIGIGNDGIMRVLGENLPPFQVVFLRFTMAAAVLLPIMLFKGGEAFKSVRLWMHGVRGALLALGIGLWCKGLSQMPFASCVVINNTMPFFKMLFAMIFLQEKVGKERWLASIGGFIGCLIVFNPTAATFQPSSLVLLLSACCFAMLDIFNKKYATSETVVSMLFYGSVATATVSAVKAVPGWVPVTAAQFQLFTLLGIGANLLLFCLLKAFAYVDASATCPYRYTEFVLSAIVGFLVFGEKPMASTLIGSAIILPSVVYCAMVETRREPEKAAESSVEE